jgi:ABC-type multidrug transport system ATPase subunit
MPPFNAELATYSSKAYTSAPWATGEALGFSVRLRQTADISREEKLEYVDHMMEILDIWEFAVAVLGIPGVGLNVEQRKILTISVKLQPQPLVFFDEPSSRLDTHQESGQQRTSSTLHNSSILINSL